MDQSDGSTRSRVVTGPRRRKRVQGPVLGDHRRVGKRFVPPFVAMLGSLNPVKWIDDLLPEMLWLGMLNNDHGHRRGIQVAEELAKAADRATASEHRKAFAMTSAYSSIPSERWPEVIRLISANALDELQQTLRPFVALYPRCPFRGLWRGEPQPQGDDVSVMRRQVATLVNRGGRPAMLAQTNAIYIAIITEKLVINHGSMLSKIEAITSYPDTDESRMVGSAVRAATLMLGRHTEEERQEAADWTRYFWQ